MTRRAARRIEWAAGAAILAVYLVHGALAQPRTTVHDGLGWDGVFYHRTAERFARGEELSGQAPYIHRLAAPRIAAWIAPQDPRDGFLAMNLAANIVYALLLVPWFRRWIRTPWLRIVALLLCIAHWHGPVRHLFVEPVTVDPWANTLMLAGLLAIMSRHAAAPFVLVGATAAGVLFRESLLLLPLAAAAQEFFAPRRTVRGRGAAVLCAAAAGLFLYAACRLTVVETHLPFSFAAAALDFLYRKSLPLLVHPLFLAYGPLIAIFIKFPRDLGRLMRVRPGATFFLVATVILSMIGGSRAERILLWAFPVVLACAGRIAERRAATVLAPAPAITFAVTLAVSGRMFFTTPDFFCPAPDRFVLFLTPLGSRFPYMDLLADGAGIVWRLVSLLQYLYVTLLLHHLMGRAAHAREEAPA